MASALIACGGSLDEPKARVAVSQQVSVQGVDGASVSYTPVQLAGRAGEGLSAPTVRVAKDSNGAPVLPLGFSAAGAVYQFTPLGWAQHGIEVRVPFDAALADAAVVTARTPVLLAAQPSGTWAQVSGAVRQGNTLVARVPRLAYATVVLASGGAVATQSASNPTKAGVGRAQQASSVGSAVPASASVLGLSVSSQTAPPLPAPACANCPPVVTQATLLMLEVKHDFPATCGPNPKRVVVEAVNAFTAFGGTPVPEVLADRLVTESTGAFNVTKPLQGGPAAYWTFYTYATCQLTPDAPDLTLLSENVISVVADVKTSVAAPAITQDPASVGVVEGHTATFSVVASGSNLVYQWQRSNDGGASYTDLPNANTASTSLVASLADHGSLWRVVVSNSAGSVTSGTAQLNVAHNVVPPAISSDPAHQTVVEGETASFTVAGSGAPAPTTQWQTRSAADAASGNAQQGWADVPGATAATYTTATTTLAQSGAQYRAVLQNSAGSATSLAATLTVNAAVVAPAITTPPQAQTVQVGNSGLFSVAASGTSPLSYQWFKNGQPIVGANATEVLVLAEAADVGGSYPISVQVSNAVGSVTSAAAVMSITAPPMGGTLISAAEGGFISANTGADVEPTLIVPPGALADNATLTVTAQSSAVANLPPGITPLGDVITIGGPSSAVFSTPATLYLAVPEAVAEGKVLAVVELEGDAPTGSGKTSTTRAKRSAAVAPTAYNSPGTSNLRRMAAGQNKPTGVRLMASGDTLRVLCPDAQDIRGGSVLVDIRRAAVSFVVTEAPEGACTGKTSNRPKAVIPPTTTAPCREADYVDYRLGEQASLVSRHVSCQRGGAIAVRFADATKDYGTYQLDWSLGSDGAAKGLSKTYRLKLRLRPLEPTPGESLPAIKVRPSMDCSSQQFSDGTCSNDWPTRSLSANSFIEISHTVRFDWPGGDNTYNVFTLNTLQMRFAFANEDVNTADRSVGLGQPPAIRCDKKMAVNKSDGCVYAQAPAVYVLTVGGPEKEAAEHIRDAQAAGSRGGLLLDGDRYLAAPSNALQRVKFGPVKARNRAAACTSAASLRVTRPASLSTSCQLSLTGCQCDEYPYASTWNGAAFDPAGTSVRMINGDTNGEGGVLHQKFLQAESIPWPWRSPAFAEKRSCGKR